MDVSAVTFGSLLHGDRARPDGPAHQTMAGHRCVDSQQLFPNALRVGVGEGEPDVVGERADVGGVVVEAFQFDEQRAQPVHLIRYVDAEGVFDGQAVRECVRDGRCHR